jgi:hypothetical protein
MVRHPCSISHFACALILGRDVNQSDIHDLVKELNIQFDNLCQVGGKASMSPYRK